jgi:hypothetical protein
VVCEQLALCSLGCGWLDRAALRLELERWYVGTVIPDGGVGGLPGVVEQLDVGAAALKDLSAECIEMVVPMQKSYTYGSFVTNSNYGQTWK